MGNVVINKKIKFLFGGKLNLFKKNFKNNFYLWGEWKLIKRLVFKISKVDFKVLFKL